MKLVRLEVEGFTSFKKRAELSFEGLDLFVIWGPTGAGKSSLLDAITFALYGKVERVGKQVAQLRSSGAAMLSVQLEFEASGGRFQVTRKLRAGGTQKVLLERASGDGWIDAGDGADKVEAVNALVTSALGIDYDAFVRTVVLPQGEFARFLNGEAKERRAILSDLLGLGIYERMKIAANDHAKRLRIEADSKADLAERTLAHATPEALAAIGTQIEDLALRGASLAETRKVLDERSERSAALTQSSSRLLDGLHAVVETRARLATLEERLEQARRNRDALTPEVDGAEQALSDATRAVDEATREYEALVEQRGPDQRLRELRDLARDAARVRNEISAAEQVLGRTRTLLAEGQSALKTLLETFKEHTVAAGQAASDVDAASMSLDAARRADHASAACEGLGPGDPCPVCASPLPEPLPVGSASSLSEATAARAAAVERQRGLEQQAREAEVAVARAQDRIAKLEEDVSAQQASVSGFQERLAGVEATLTEASVSSAGALELLDAELAERDRVQTALGRLRTERDEGRDRLDRARSRAASIDDEIKTLDAQSVATAESFARTLPKLLSGEAGVSPDAGLEVIETELRGLLDANTAEHAALLDELRDRTGTALGTFASIEDAASKLDRLEREHASSEATLVAKRGEIERQIEQRREVLDEIDALGERSDRFKAVGDLLASNRFVEFLQEEALHGLCAAGNEHLVRLTSDRYRLAYADGSFSVLDRWSADERRPSKTLSGGETFLASLALALALSDHVTQMRIAGAVKLESLFLDEGFGSLDHATLSDVEEALHRLVATGRQVGVITHLAELAERMPVRIEVVKHPAGSTIAAM